MTTIILTIIGILLAAAAALMVIFYGGDAFNSGSIGAQANTLQNAATNVSSAVQLYRSEVGPGPTLSGATPPDAFNDFLTKTGAGGSYLKERPSLSSSMEQGLNTNASRYTITGSEIQAPLCQRINKNLKRGDANGVLAGKVGKMGCDTSDNVFFANI